MRLLAGGVYANTVCVDMESQVGGFMETNEPQSPLLLSLLMCLPMDASSSVMNKMVARAQSSTDSCYHRLISTSTQMMTRGVTSNRYSKLTCFMVC